MGGTAENRGDTDGLTPREDIVVRGKTQCMHMWGHVGSSGPCRSAYHRLEGVVRSVELESPAALLSFPWTNGRKMDRKKVQTHAKAARVYS